jgi:hypothetical protein
MVLCTPLNEAFWTPPMLLNRLMPLLTLGVIAGQIIARQPSVFSPGCRLPHPFASPANAAASQYSQ